MGLKHMQALNLLRGDAQHQAHGFMALAHLHRHHALLGANRKRAQYQLLHRGRAPRHAHAAGQQIFVLQAAHQPGQRQHGDDKQNDQNQRGPHGWSGCHCSTCGRACRVLNHG